MTAVFPYQIIKRTNQTVIHKLNESRVSHDDRSVFCWIGCLCGVHDLTSFGSMIAIEFCCCCTTIIFRSISYSVYCWKVAGKNTDGLTCRATISCIYRRSHQSYKCSNKSQSFKKHILFLLRFPNALYYYLF